MPREQESFIECSKEVTRSGLNFPFLQKSVFDFSIFTKKEKVLDLKFCWTFSNLYEIDSCTGAWSQLFKRLLVLPRYEIASLCVLSNGPSDIKSTAKRFPIKIENIFYSF